MATNLHDARSAYAPREHAIKRLEKLGLTPPKSVTNARARVAQSLELQNTRTNTEALYEAAATRLLDGDDREEVVLQVLIHDREVVLIERAQQQARAEFVNAVTDAHDAIVTTLRTKTVTPALNALRTLAEATREGDTFERLVQRGEETTALDLAKADMHVSNLIAAGEIRQATLRKSIADWTSWFDGHEVEVPTTVEGWLTILRDGNEVTFRTETEANEVAAAYEDERRRVTAARKAEAQASGFGVRRTAVRL